jgi:hypothetical protein
MRIRTMAITVMIAGTLAASTGLAGAAQASGSVDPGTGWNEIYLPFDNGRANTMCVDDPGGSRSAGTLLQFFHCHGYASNGSPQRWQFLLGGAVTGVGAYYRIRNTGSGMCIGFGNGVEASRTDLVLENCDSAPSWLLFQNPGSGAAYFGLVALNTNICMAAGGLDDSNGTLLMGITCSAPGDAAQILSLG